MKWCPGSFNGPSSGSWKFTSTAVIPFTSGVCLFVFVVVLVLLRMSHLASQVLPSESHTLSTSIPVCLTPENPACAAQISTSATSATFIWVATGSWSSQEDVAKRRLTHWSVSPGLSLRWSSYVCNGSSKTGCLGAPRYQTCLGTYLRNSPRAISL